MNTLVKPLKHLGVTALLATSSVLHAQSVWTGSVDGTSWSTAGNWSPSGVPNVSGGDAAVIGAGTVQYNPGGDLTFGGGGSLTLNGGSFTQIVGNAWMNVGNGVGSDGSIIINGGTFSSGTSGNLRIGFGGGTGLVEVNGGAFNPNGLDVSASGTLRFTGGTSTIAAAYNSSGSLQISGSALVNYTSGNFAPGGGAITVGGGTFAISGELKPLNNNFTVSGGSITTSLISFDGVTSSLDLSAGSVTIANASFDGIFAAGNGYVNFTPGSSGALILSSVSSTSAANLLTGRVRVNDAIDADAFIITSINAGAGSMITLVAAIPEPSAYPLLAATAALGFVALRRRRA